MAEKSHGLALRVAVGSLSSALEVGAERAPQAADDLANILNSLGCEIVKLGAIDTPARAVAAGRRMAETHVHSVVLAATSWYEDYLVLDLLEECEVPVLLWSLPGMETGALCGSQQLSSYLKQLDVPYRCIYGSLDSDEQRSQALAFLRAASLKHKLRRVRVGFAGHNVAGMTETAVNQIALKRAIGPRVVPLDLPQLLARVKEMTDEKPGKIWKEVVDSCGVCKVSQADGLDSVKVYLAVKELVEQHSLDGLTIGCYPHLMGRVCLAASLLADEAIPLGCEGDLNGTVGQVILSLLTGKPTHNTDWLEPLEDGTVVFTHCGSGSFSLAEKAEQITLAPVRLMEQGVCALFPCRPGPVTLINLMPCGKRYQCALLDGQAVSTEMVFPGNPLRVCFSRQPSELIDWIHNEGIGHHWMAGYAHVGPEIRQWASIVGPYLRLIEP